MYNNGLLVLWYTKDGVMYKADIQTMCATWFKPQSMYKVVNLKFTGQTHMVVLY